MALDIGNFVFLYFVSALVFIFHCILDIIEQSRVVQTNHEIFTVSKAVSASFFFDCMDPQRTWQMVAHVPLYAVPLSSRARLAWCRCSI